MDVSKLPPPALPLNKSSTAPTKEQLAGEIAAVLEHDLQTLSKPASAGDRANIRPLDIPGGLQILLAEIRASLDVPADAAAPGSPESFPDSPLQAARQIVEWMLKALPDDAADVPAWTAALAKMESSLESGLQQASDTVAAWHDVAPAVVDAVQQSGSLVRAVLGDVQPNPLWVRPEWAGMAPRLERLWRRRRGARRRLTDPDHWRGSLDDNDEYRTQSD
jgi:hypothetical protein